MNPLIHIYAHTETSGMATLKTVIEYSFIDDSLKIYSIKHVLNDSFTFQSEPDAYLHYLLNYGRQLITHAEGELLRHKKMAQSHDKTFLERLQTTGVPA